MFGKYTGNTTHRQRVTSPNHGDVHSGGGGGGGERLGVELDVIFHVGRDEKVRVVAASVSAHSHLLSHFLSRCLERLRLELLCRMPGSASPVASLHQHARYSAQRFDAAVLEAVAAGACDRR